MLKDYGSAAAGSIDRLIMIFDQCFYERFNTRLVLGDDEPVYLVADHQTRYNQVVFANGYFFFHGFYLQFINILKQM